MNARALLALSLILVFSWQETGWSQTGLPGPSKPEGARDRQILERGKPIERALAVGGVHSYEIVLTAHQYVSVILEKHGVALVARLFEPNGRRIGLFGSSTSRQGQEPITFLTDVSGTYRIEVFTMFKPTPPGRYQVKLEELRAASAQDRNRLAGQSCEEKYWLDSQNNFVVDVMLTSMARCMSAVGRKLETEYPRATEIADGASSEVAYLVSRWHWGEFVSEAYQVSLDLDFKMLASAAKETDQKRAYAIMRAVADDLKIKAVHCRNSTRGLGKDVKVQVETRKVNKIDQGWQVYYKFQIYEFVKGYTPLSFPKPSSPTSRELPPSYYFMWAEKPGQAKPVQSKVKGVEVGKGMQQVEVVLEVD